MPLCTNYRRLGRLILYAVLTDEFLRMVNDRSLWEHTGFTTVAYTDAPVSMKYRGLFELANRKDGAVSGTKNALVYRSKRMVAETIQGGFERWYDKHGRDLATRATPSSD